jgi:hypothetical protein
VILVRVVAPVSTGPRRGQSIAALARVVHDLNVSFLRAHRDFPRLYASGVRYRAEPPEVREQFCTAPATLAQGWGDCDDLAPWRSAELLVCDGIDAWPVVARVGPRTWHVVVQTADGRTLDPSRRLGMVDP